MDTNSTKRTTRFSRQARFSIAFLLTASGVFSGCEYSTPSPLEDFRNWLEPIDGFDEALMAQGIVEVLERKCEETRSITLKRQSYGFVLNASNESPAMSFNALGYCRTPAEFFYLSGVIGTDGRLIPSCDVFIDLGATATSVKFRWTEHQALNSCGFRAITPGIAKSAVEPNIDTETLEQRLTSLRSDLVKYSLSVSHFESDLGESCESISNDSIDVWGSTATASKERSPALLSYVRYHCNSAVPDPSWFEWVFVAPDADGNLSAYSSVSSDWSIVENMVNQSVFEPADTESSKILTDFHKFEKDASEMWEESAEYAFALGIETSSTRIIDKPAKEVATKEKEVAAKGHETDDARIMTKIPPIEAFDVTIDEEERIKLIENWIVGDWTAEGHLFNKVHSNLSLQSDGTISYESCREFGELVERKFEPIIFEQKTKVIAKRYSQTGLIYYSVIQSDDGSGTLFFVDRNAGLVTEFGFANQTAMVRGKQTQCY